MTGLILTDFYAMKKNLAVTGVIALMYMILGLVTGSCVELVAFLIFFAVMQVVSAYSYGERAKLDLLANTLPISRKHIVLSKYVLMGILLTVSAVCGCLTLLVSDLVHNNIGIEDYSVVLLCVMAGLLFAVIVMPLILKFGSEKARYMLVAIYVIPFALFYVLGKELNINNVMVGLFVADIFALIASMFISIRIYEKKDF